MAKECDITKKKPMVGNRRSHSNMKTKTRNLPNLMKCQIWDPVTKKYVSLKVSARGKRTINKLGLSAAIAKAAR